MRLDMLVGELRRVAQQLRSERTVALTDELAEALRDHQGLLAGIVDAVTVDDGQSLCEGGPSPGREASGSRRR